MSDPVIERAYQLWKPRMERKFPNATTRELELAWEAFTGGYEFGNLAGYDDACDAGPDAEDDSRWEADL